MKRIELEIVADNSQYLAKTKEVEVATVSMHKKANEGTKRQKGLIDDTVEELKKYEKQRNRAFTIEGVEKYNKKIAEAKLTLQEYNKAGLETVKTQEKQKKSTGDMISSLTRLVAGYFSVRAAMKLFNAVMNSTQQSGDLLRREISGIKFSLDELSRTVATGNWAELGKRLSEARKAGMDYADALDSIGDRERQLQLEETDRQIKLVALAKIYRSTGLVGAEGYKKRKDAAEEFIKISEEGEQAAIELLKIRLAAELSNARQILGLNDKYAKADEAEKARIDKSIIDNIRSQKSFEDNKKAFEEYSRLRIELARESSKRNPDDAVVNGIKNAMESFPEDIKNLRRGYLEWGEVTDEVRIKLTNAYDAIGKKQVEVSKSTIRANTMAELAGTMLAKEEGKALDERQKKLEEFLQATLQLQDQYDKSQIDKLQGPERFAAERDYQMKQLANLRAHLESMGNLTEEHYRWIAGLEEDVNIEFLKKSADYDQKNFDEMVGHGDKVRELERKLQEEALDLVEDNEKEKLKLKIKFAEEDIKILQAIGSETSQAEIAILKQRIAIWNKEINKEEGGAKTIWDIFGLGDNPEAQDAIKSGIKATTDALDEIFDARVEDAKRTRELLDTQISESQRSLEAEVELAKLGYANNVDAKRKEIEDLKVARDRALKDEEKALKAQRALDTVSQLSSLITASAEIFKTMSKIPVVGVPLAIAMIATMFGAFAAAKASAAASTKLAKGGTGDETGVITGRSHAQGGERFLDHVEVERGERWGVLNRKASAKYGRAFSDIVTSFNKDRIPIDSVTADSNIIVDVNQTNERLDRVHGELVRLNSKFGNKKERTDLGDRIIEKLGPHKTRIIRK